MILAALLAPLTLTAAAATAAEVDLPAPPAASLPQGAPPSPGGTIGAPVPTVTMTVLRLRTGMRGPQVRDLQRELRRRGMRVAVDGAFGAGTKRAVQAMQRRFRMRPTGVADAALLRRLGLRARGAASAPEGDCTSTVLAMVDPPGPIVVGSTPPPILWPVRGVASSHFGWRGGRMHEGVDIPCDHGVPVAAANGGRVTHAGWMSGYGNLVVVQRDGGLSTAYGHLSSIAVELGQVVGTGQLVGEVGATGNARGTHLHFEVRLSSGAADPMPYLDGTVPPPPVEELPEEPQTGKA